VITNLNIIIPMSDVCGFKRKRKERKNSTDHKASPADPSACKSLSSFSSSLVPHPHPSSNSSFTCLMMARYDGRVHSPHSTSHSLLSDWCCCHWN
jgi:hypothetical protein